MRGADNPLLIFPEGTCVNNHYTVMFKKVNVFLLLVTYFYISFAVKFNDNMTQVFLI